MCTKSLSANDEENVSLQHGRGGGEGLQEPMMDLFGQDLFKRKERKGRGGCEERLIFE